LRPCRRRRLTPHFSSGPCKKRPGWSTDIYKGGMRTRACIITAVHKITRTPPSSQVNTLPKAKSQA
jgi:hypothetical protein